MSRLTKHIREQMLKTMLNHAFLEKQKQAEAELDKAGDALYMAHHAPHLAVLNQLPKSFVYRDSRFDINIAGQSHVIYFEDKRVMTYESNCSRVSFGADHHEAQAYLAAVDKLESINEQRNDKYREVNAVLESVHTFKKLWEVWPECKTLLEKFEQKPSIAILPTVQVHRLNSELGLPVCEGGLNG